jgi:hypothetical protein
MEQTNNTFGEKSFGCLAINLSPCKTFILEKQFKVGKIIQLNMEFENYPSFTFFFFVS